MTLVVMQRNPAGISDTGGNSKVSDCIEDFAFYQGLQLSASWTYKLPFLLGSSADGRHLLCVQQVGLGKGVMEVVSGPPG